MRLPSCASGSSSSTRPFFGSQPPMSATTKKRVSGTCTMVRGKIRPSSVLATSPAQVPGRMVMRSLGYGPQRSAESV